MKEIHYEKRLKLLKLPSLEYCRLRGDIIQVFKIVKEEYEKKKPTNNRFTESTNLNSNTRNKNTLKLLNPTSKESLDLH